MMEGSRMISAGQEGSMRCRLGVAPAPGSFYTRGYIIKEMDENNDPVGRMD